MVIILPVMWWLGVFDELFAAADTGATVAPDASEPSPLMLTIQLIVLGQVLFFALHGWLLYKHGQTIAKKLLGMQIVDEQGRVPPFGKLALRRYVIMAVLAAAKVKDLPSRLASLEA